MSDVPVPHRSHQVVLVTGPRLAGVTGVAAAVRDRLPDHTVVEATELRPGEVPAAVVFVISATAPPTESDCALLDDAAARTDLVVGVVAKTDVHRTWRTVLRAARAALAAHDRRYAEVCWVGAAAAPDIGPPKADRLVEVLRAGLADPTLNRRNLLRAEHYALTAEIRRTTMDPDGRIDALRDRRAATLRRRQLDRSRQAITLRRHTQQARLQLSYLARNRCASVRADLQHDAATTTRRTRAAFVATARQRVSALVDEVDGAVTARLTEVGTDLGLGAPDIAVPPGPPIDVPAPPPRSRGETRLMTLLGAGFGLGVALTLSRLLADVATGPAAAVGCAVLGVALTAWVVGTRGLLQDRATLERWVADVLTTLRLTLEERVVTRVLTAESVFGGAAARRDVAAAAAVDDEIADIDRQIRGHAASHARALAACERRLPDIVRAVAAIEAELACHAPTRVVRSPEQPTGGAF